MTTLAVPRFLPVFKIPLLDRIAYPATAVFVLIALVGPWIAPHDPYQVDLNQALLAPGAGHWLGTDSAGRDILSRLLAGARTTVLSSVVVTVGAAVVGIVVAAVAALGGRVVDEVVMRVCDIFLSIPGMILALGVAAALGPSLRSTIIALVVALWPAFARLVRAVLRETMASTYVESARTLGVPPGRLMLRHVLPNSLDSLYVQAALDVSGVIVLMSGLSFLGVGAQPPSADWGAMVADGREYVTTAWWVATVPGLAITLTAVVFGLFGDALRVRLDPTLGD
ncbi:ABC transporter permease [Paractinoplanes toevensis]|uniref:Peptide ABC transporter permease n=1 Tax=Paractinoplanes toevensis TaxID=571911 RepID=A0A919TB94_9ACTN|nr:ABC transporter permease [Actinoplanes toevensis]GIM91591.1 peptide ABC transporter permease [Actinoplanes toevensis]